MHKLLLLCVLLLTGFALPNTAQAACTDIPSLPATLAAAGNYCLSASHVENLGSGAAITIAASHVSVDCLGHTISNTNTDATSANNSYGIYAANRAYVTIKNCHVTGGFAIGIYAYQNNSLANQNAYVTIKDNYIVGPTWYGILAYGSAIEIEGNRVYDVGGRTGSAVMGIRVAGSNLSGQNRFFLVRNNLVAGTVGLPYNAYGFYADNTVAAIFTNNGVTGTSGAKSWGFRLGGTYNRVTDNHVVGSGRELETGIESTSSTDTCHDNYIRTPTGTVTCNASLGNF
jgi:hypothetical protein